MYAFPILFNIGLAFGVLGDSKAPTNQFEISRKGTFVSPLWVAWAPCWTQGGPGIHFAPPEGPPGVHLGCFWLQFLYQVVQTLHELSHLFLDGFPIL